MAKRAARRSRPETDETGRVHSLFFDSPRAVVPFEAQERDQSYIRNVRPRSDNQRALMEAIDMLNPRLIMVRQPAFGLDGPYRAYRTFGNHMEAIAAQAYQAAGPAAGGGGGGGAPNGAPGTGKKKGDDDVIDAECEETN